MKKFYKILSFILVFISLCLIGCNDNDESVYYKEHTAQEHYDFIKENCDKSYENLVKMDFLEDYKVYLLYDSMNKPRYFLIELIGLVDLKEVESKIKEDFWNFYLDLTDYSFEFDTLDEETIESYKQKQLTAEYIIEKYQAKRVNVQFFGILTNYIYGDYDVFDFSAIKGHHYKSLNYYVLEEVGYPSKWIEQRKYSITYTASQQLEDEDLITNSEYKDKKLYFMPLFRRDEYMLGYEENGGIISITNGDYYHRDTVRVGCSSMDIRFRVSDYYKKQIPKAYYPHLTSQWWCTLECSLTISSGHDISWKREQI